MGALIRLLGCLGLLLVGIGALLSIVVLAPLAALWALLSGRSPAVGRIRVKTAPGAPRGASPGAPPAADDTIDVEAVVVEEDKNRLEEKPKKEE